MCRLMAKRWDCPVWLNREDACCPAEWSPRPVMTQWNEARFEALAMCVFGDFTPATDRVLFNQTALGYLENIEGFATLTEEERQVVLDHVWNVYLLLPEIRHSDDLLQPGSGLLSFRPPTPLRPSVVPYALGRGGRKFGAARFMSSTTSGEMPLSSAIRGEITTPCNWARKSSQRPRSTFQFHSS